jgi:hypothetical protein
VMAQLETAGATHEVLGFDVISLGAFRIVVVDSLTRAGGMPGGFLRHGVLLMVVLLWLRLTTKGDLLVFKQI